MPTTASNLQEFVDTLQASQLLESKVVNRVVKSLDGQSVDPEKVANLLVQKNLLTRYQVELLLRGKSQGFFIGTYKILSLLSSRSSGKVYLAHHTSLKRQVAIKVLPESQSSDSAKKARFEKEARTIAALDHQNILKVYDINEEGEILYLVMEYAEGVDLQKRLDKKLTLSADIAVGYILQAAAGLEHAHSKGMIHRDVRPGNLLVNKDGTIKLLEMGLSTARTDNQGQVEQSDHSHDGMKLHEYRSPEQLAGQTADQRSDIYSLGATLYALLTGVAPSPQGGVIQELHQVKASVPRKVSDIVAKMMVTNPDERYQTMTEVRSALNAIEFVRRASAPSAPLPARTTVQTPYAPPPVRSASKATAPVARYSSPPVHCSSPPTQRYSSPPTSPVVEEEQPRKRSGKKKFKKSRKKEGSSRLVMGLVVGGILLATFAGIAFMITRLGKGNPEQAQQKTGPANKSAVNSLNDIKHVRLLTDGKALTLVPGDQSKLVLAKDDDLPTQRWEVVVSGIYIRLKNAQTGQMLCVQNPGIGQEITLADEKDTSSFTKMLWEVPWQDSRWNVVSQNGKMAIAYDRAKGIVQHKSLDSDLSQYWTVIITKKN